MTVFSFQLFSARQAPSLDAVFAMLKQHGYRQVEGYGSLYSNIDELTTLLDKHELAMPTGHFDLTMLESNIDQALIIAERLNMRTMICPFIKPELRPQSQSVQGWLELGHRLERIASQVRAEGYDFGWHNHDFEFHPLEDGSLPMEAILTGAPTLRWEMDLAWIAKGKQDPLEWLSRYQNRICSVHLKDIAPEGECLDEDGWADFTTGVLPWSQWWPVIRATPATQFIMEHDNPSDITRFAKRAIDGARKLAGEVA
ncbi:sugar phosphate isomerase/epimerase family protein [Gynuella sp.]|uniref:sugar phosphate isomerase/epimerase family protein n=1 Tax=Gynuella sp. TaxID=2969146 RepID=UPI003D13A4B2